MTAMPSAETFAFRAESMDPVAVKRCFDAHGIVILKSLLDSDFIADIRHAIESLVGARLHSLGLSGGAEDLDGQLGALLAADQHYAMEIITVLKDSPEYYRAFTNEAIIKSVKTLLATDTLQCIHDISQFRIDPPNFDVRNFAWHQDYQYNVASQNAVTAWFPITPIGEDMGFLAVAPGTHRQMLKVIEDRSSHLQGRGTTHSTLRFDVDAGALERRAVLLDNVRPRDVVFFHSLLLHRSGWNRSQRARFVMNPRYADALDPAVVARGWVAMRDRTQDAFARYYPDMILTASKSDTEN